MTTHKLTTERLPDDAAFLALYGRRVPAYARRYWGTCSCGWTAGPHPNKVLRFIHRGHVLAKSRPMDPDPGFAVPDVRGCGWCGHEDHVYAECPARPL